MIFGDDLLGTTNIDLEDRYFTQDWMSLEEKPIEYRQLYHPSTNMSQGTVKVWTEIIKYEEKDKRRVYDLTPKPKYPVEVRICIHNCEGIPMDEAESAIDAFFKGIIGKDNQETDCHYRNFDGKPDFQYRLIYKVQYPGETKFTLQGYDRDFFKSNDCFGFTEIDLQQIIEDVSLIKQPLSYNKSYYKDVIKKNKTRSKEDQDRYGEPKFDSSDANKFWMKLINKDPKTGKMVKCGKVAIRVDVLPQEMADKNPVGKARDTPNHSPQLPQPQGRLELTLNPMKLLMQFIPPSVRRKLIMIACCILCLMLCAFMLPNILGGLIVNAISG